MLTEKSGELTAFDACCDFGGGYRHGENLLMDPYSTTKLFSSINGDISIACGCPNCRYDTLERQCVSFCADGYMWNDSTSLDTGTMTLAGQCVECEAGTVSDNTNGSFPLMCKSCEPGRFASRNGSNECTLCDKNMFAESYQSTVCLMCPFGKQAQSGQATCSPCDEMYIGSEHCDLPILGGAITLGVLLIFVILICLWRRHNIKKQQHIRHLSMTVHMKEERLRAQSTDIALLSQGMMIREDEVKFEKELASGTCVCVCVFFPKPIHFISISLHPSRIHPLIHLPPKKQARTVKCGTVYYEVSMTLRLKSCLIPRESISKTMRRFIF